MIEQLARVARIFAGDQVNIFQSFDGAECKILQISNRRGDQIKSSFHFLMLMQKALFENLARKIKKGTKNFRPFCPLLRF